MTALLATSDNQRRLLAWLAILAAAAGLLTLAAASDASLVFLPVAVIVGLAILKHPWLGIALLVASVPAQQAGAAAGGALTVTRACLPLAIGGYALMLLVQRQRVAFSRLTLPFAGLLGWMIWTAGSARDVNAATSEIARWTITLVAFVIAVQALSNQTRRVATSLVVAMALAGALESAFGTALGVLGIGPESFMVGNAFSRAYGTFGRPNTFAGYLEMTLFPVAWLGIYLGWAIRPQVSEYLRSRTVGFAASATARRQLMLTALLPLVLVSSSVMILAGIAISYSRGAWLGVLAGAAVTGFVAVRRHLPVVVALGLIMMLAGAVGASRIAPDAVTVRLDSVVSDARLFDASSISITPDNFAVVERMAHWQAGWRMFEDNPLDGVGIGNFNARYPDYFVRTQFRISQGHAHNFYVHVLAETGVVGLLLYLTLTLGFMLLAGKVAWSADGGYARFLALGALGTMVAVAVHNLFEDLHVLNLGIQLSVTWALAIAAHHIWRTGFEDVGISNVEYSRE